MMKSYNCAKLYNLIRLSHKGSYSVDAALQMWRIESKLILSADLIGVRNPEEGKSSQTRTRVGIHWEEWILSMVTALKPPRSNIPNTTLNTLRVWKCERERPEQQKKHFWRLKTDWALHPHPRPPWWVSWQRAKKPVSALAMLTGKLLRVRKVFA